MKYLKTYEQNKNDKNIKISFSEITPDEEYINATIVDGWVDDIGVSMTPNKEEIENGLTSIDKTIKYLNDNNATNPSYSSFEPDIYYSTEQETDFLTNTDIYYYYHLNGFSIVEQNYIYDIIENNTKLNFNDYKKFKKASKYNIL